MPDPQNPQNPNPNQQISIDDWEEVVRNKYQIPRNLWQSMSSQESGGDWNATSPTGVKGKYQVTQSTARQYGLDRNDPYQQVVAAAKHLRAQYDSLKDIKDDNARWLGAVGKYYGGGDAVDRQGNLSTQTRDNLSNPAVHVERVAKKWGELNRADGAATAPQASAAPSATPAPQYDGHGRRKIGYADVGITPTEGMNFDLSGGKTGNAPAQSPTRSQAPAKAPTRQQQMTALAEAMRARDAKPEHIAEAQQRLSKLSNADFAKESARLFKLFGTVPEYATQRAEQERKRAEYYAQPLYQQIGQEIVGGMARVGEGAQRAANRVLRPALEAVGFKEEVQRGRAGEEATAQKLTEKEELANSLRSKIVRGTTAGAGNAAIMAPLAMVGGAPAVTLATAAQQDWEKDPAGALAATAGAAVPIYAGRAITPLAGRAANAFTSPVAGKAAQLGVEGLAGAGANVGQFAATQAALGRPVNADDLIEQGVTGGMLSAALAPKLSGRRASAPVVDETMAAPLRSQTARESATQDYASRVEPGMLARGYVRQVEEINRTVADPQAKQAALDQARTQYQEARRALQAKPQQQAVEQSQTPEAAPAPALPEGVQIIRQGEAIPPRQRGQRMLPMEVDKGDGSVETVTVIAPDQINGQRASESVLRPMVEGALRPQVQSQPAAEMVGQPKPQPVQTRKAGEDVQVFRAGEQPEYDPATQKVITFKGPDKQDYIAVAPKNMSRADAAAFGRDRVQPAESAQKPATEQTEPLTQRQPQQPQPDAAQRLIARTRQNAENLIAQGRYDEAINELKAHQQALKDAKAAAGRNQPGLRVQLERQMGAAGNRIGEVRAMAQRAGKDRARAENAPTGDATAPLLGSVVNPEGGVPQAPESASGRFGALARRQSAEQQQPQRGRKASSQLSAVEYLKRATGGEGVRVSDRGEARVLGAKEAGIVALTNRNSKFRTSDAQVMLDEGGFTLPDGRKFTDSSVTENDVLTFLSESGKQVRQGTRGLDQRLADEEAEHYRQQEEAAKGQEAATSETTKNLTHPNPAINGKPIIAQTADGKAVVANPENRSGVSVVKDRSEPLKGSAAIDPDLLSAQRKLGTDDPAEISQLIRDADKRFKKSATEGEKAAADRAWAKVQRLTAAEQQAISKVIPERVFAPVREDYQGEPGETYSRAVSDIPLSEKNAQLDKNLAEVLDFFDEMARTDTEPPKLVQDAANRLKEAASGKRAGSGGQQLADMAIVAGYKAYRAGVDFATWAKEVVETIGEQVRPHLRKVWNQIQTDMRQMGAEARSLRGRLDLSPEIRAKAIADSPTDDTKVSVAALGLKSKFPPQPARGAKPRNLEVNIQDITLGRDNLSKGRMNQVESALKREGFKSAGGKVDPVSVVPDPKQPGKWVVLEDGNHRLALLQLAGVKGKIPVKAWVGESEAMSSKSYWGTESIAGRPSTPGDVRQAWESIGAEFRTRTGDREGTLYTNQQGMLAAESALRRASSTADEEASSGRSIKLATAERMADHLRQRAESWGGKAGANLEKLAGQIDEAVADARANGRNSIAIVDTTAEHPLYGPLEYAKMQRRHEATHNWQWSVNEKNQAILSDKAITKDPDYARIKSALGDYYENIQPNEVMAEAVAFTASGDWYSVGMTKQQAAAFLDRFFTNVQNQHGQAALDSLKLVHPVAKEVLENVKSRTGRPASGPGGLGQPPTAGSRNALSVRAPQGAGRDSLAARTPQSGVASGRQGGVGRGTQQNRSGEDLSFRERLGRKIGTAQAVAQLGNPKTILANTISNAAFSGAKNVATIAALPIDKLLSLRTNQRQVAAPELRTQMRDFVDGFADVWHAVRTGDYKALSENGKFDISNERAFKGRVGKFAEDVMDIALRGPDRGAYLAAYNDAVSQIQKGLAKSKKPFSLDQIHEQAKMEAQQAVFQDDNVVSKLTVGLKQALNKISPFGAKANFGLADVIGLKYPRVPGSLVMRAIEYSPAGFAKAIYKAGKVLAGRGADFDQREASLAFGKAFVGSAFGAGMGALLYQMGVIMSPEKEDRGVAAAERGEGLGGYQVNLSALKRYAMSGLLDGDMKAGQKQRGDIMMSYDWLQPWAFALGMGAAAMRAHDKTGGKKEALEDVLGQIDAATSTLTDQSILKNVRDIAKQGFAATGRKVLTDTPSSFVPAVLNQTRQIIDDRARETSHEKGAKGIEREALDKVLNRLPVASKRLPERKDIVGRSVPSRLEGAAGAALVPVPGRFSEYRPHPVLSEMGEIQAGSTGVQRKPGETEGQFSARRARAQSWLNTYGLQLVGSAAYRSASKEERQKAMEILRSHISQQSGEQKPKIGQFNPDAVMRSAKEIIHKPQKRAFQ